MKNQVLDKVFVEVVDSLGNDLTVVNSARVSFGKRKKYWDKSDEHLVRYLVKHKHFSPFRHLQVQFHIKAPEFVMRQWYKHVVGIETTSNSSTKDHACNEISGRYVPVDDYYYPSYFRKQSEDNKQASEGEIENQKQGYFLWEKGLYQVQEIYKELLELGVAKEQARTILPLSQYTEVYWTASFQAIMNFIELRDETTAQWEIQKYAQVVKELIFDIYPKITKIWNDSRK